MDMKLLIESFNSYLLEGVPESYFAKGYEDGFDQDEPDSFEEMKRSFPGMSRSEYDEYLEGFEEAVYDQDK